MANKKRILLLSAYDTPSHHYWSQTLINGLPEFEFTYLSLPARFFAWRIRGNSLTWGRGDYPELELDYDLILATSLVDITALRGFRPNLASAPLLVYFHENQFAYPVSSNQVDNVQAQLLSIYTAACADTVLFNSEFNLETFSTGASQLLKKLPDGVPNRVANDIKARASVMPVPLQKDNLVALKLPQKKPLKLLWNHRWEYDKQPELLLQVLRRVKDSVPFQIALVGQQFRNTPNVFEQIKSEFHDQLICYGYQRSEDYQTLLRESDVVLSTALHDFQGLAIQDAMAWGCVPVCPNRVAYPEYIEPALLYDVNPKQTETEQHEYEAEQMAEKIIELYQHGYESSNSSLKNYTKDKLLPEYQRVLVQTCR